MTSAPAIARVRSDICPLCDGRLRPAQIETTILGDPEPTYVDGGPWCDECDIGFTVDTWPGSSELRLWTSRSLRYDELPMFYRPIEEAG